MEPSKDLTAYQAEELILVVLESNDMIAGGIIFLDFMGQWTQTDGSVKSTYRLCLEMVEKYGDDYRKDTYVGVFDE